MKHLNAFLLLVGCLVGILLHAQSGNSYCLTKEPPKNAANTARENYMQSYREPQGAQASGDYIIPVVVHVVYQAAVENISDNQIYSQLLVLNEDFTRSNADTVNTPSVFTGVAANPHIQFCLAQTDPNGLPTTGIERRQTTQAPFNSDAVKFYNQGGLDQWDPTRYFNIWVCNALGAWGEFPDSVTTNTFGIVVEYNRFGSNYTPYGTFSNLIPGVDGGRTATHEVAHCFNVHHVWADDFNTCNGSDFCSDTPNQQSETHGSPAFPVFDSCTPSGTGIMFMNYMDYTDDSIKNIFTAEQVLRMHAVLTMAPYDSLTMSTVCQSPSGVIENHASFFVSVFPDPSDGIVSVHFSQSAGSETVINVYDEAGRLIDSQTASGSTMNVTLDLSHEANGMYFIQVSNQQAVVTKKVALSR